MGRCRVVFGEIVLACVRVVCVFPSFAITRIRSCGKGAEVNGSAIAGLGTAAGHNTDTNAPTIVGCNALVSRITVVGTWNRCRSWCQCRP